MQIIIVKYERKCIAMNSMKEISKIFSRSCENNNSVKGDIRNYIENNQTMLIAMINTPDISKKRHVIHTNQ